MVKFSRYVTLITLLAAGGCFPYHYRSPEGNVQFNNELHRFAEGGFKDVSVTSICPNDRDQFIEVLEKHKLIGRLDIDIVVLSETLRYNAREQEMTFGLRHYMRDQSGRIDFEIQLKFIKEMESDCWSICEIE